MKLTRKNIFLFYRRMDMYTIFSGSFHYLLILCFQIIRMHKINIRIIFYPFEQPSVIL